MNALFGKFGPVKNYGPVFNCRCTIIPLKEKSVSREVFRSSTMGDIPLSFTGRHLLQALRDEMTELLEGVKKRAARGSTLTLEGDWEPLSRARGRIAKYMSELEKKAERFFLGEVSATDLRDELVKRGAEVRRYNPVTNTVEVTGDAAAHIQPRDAGVRFTPPWQTADLRFGSACKPIPGKPLARRYLVEVLEPQTIKAQELGRGVITELQLGGSMEVNALSMDEAVEKVLAVAYNRGFVSLKRTDLSVRELE